MDLITTYLRNDIIMNHCSWNTWNRIHKTHLFKYSRNRPKPDMLQVLVLGFFSIKVNIFKTGQCPHTDPSDRHPWGRIRHKYMSLGNGTAACALKTTNYPKNADDIFKCIEMTKQHISMESTQLCREWCIQSYFLCIMQSIFHEIYIRFGL